MLVCLDTDYRDPRAQCAYALFEPWTAAEPAQVNCVQSDDADKADLRGFY